MAVLVPGPDRGLETKNDCDAIAERVRAKVGVPLAECRVACGAARSGRRELGGDVDVLFDLASVTKPMTAVAVARSGIDRRAPLEALVGEARGTPSGPVALELFLAHRAGLVAHIALYEPLTRGASIDVDGALRAAAGGRREDARGAPPVDGFGPLYSDLGYLLAGVALARHAGAADAGDAIDALVTLPLGLGDRLGTARGLERRGADVIGRAAKTEVVPWRGGAVVGRVHDENAWAIAGAGGCGHAGHFGTVDAVLAFGEHVLASKDELAWLWRERPGGTLRAGFDGKSTEGSSAGTRMGPRAFGHLGFTGTSLWIDPDAGVVVALLTNRVHPTRDNIAIRALRPQAHDALFARALELSSSS